MSLNFRIPFTGKLDASTVFPPKMKFTRDDQTGIIDVRQSNGDPLEDIGVLDPAVLRTQFGRKNMPDDYLLATLSIETTADVDVRLIPVTRDGILLAPRRWLTPIAPTARNMRLFTGQILRLRQKNSKQEGGILEVVLIPMLAEKLACTCHPEQAFPVPPREPVPAAAPESQPDPEPEPEPEPQPVEVG